MKYLFFLFYFIHSILYKLVINLDLNDINAFSTKIGYNEVAIFMKDKISIYKSIEGLTNTVENNPITPPCSSGIEKGGIYFNGFYYTSCKSDTYPDKFDIRIYTSSFGTSTVFPDYDVSPNLAIRFFKVTSEEEMVGVAWRYDTNFALRYFKGNEEKKFGSFTVSNIAGDFDCIFINKHQRTVCVFGVKAPEETVVAPKANIFSFASQVSNFKDLTQRSNHYSRKIRGYTDIINNPQYSDYFYYYFVDVNHEAYVIPMRLEDAVTLTEESCYRVMTQCSQEQYNYDIAENQFMGFNVFSCVNYEDTRKIKIQLFKIENNEINFYEGKSPTYVFDGDSNTRYSMINFVVLKETLSFGFLSYRNEDTQFSAFTIINQPSCNPFPTDDQKDTTPDINKLGLFQEKININFSRNIINDGLEDGAEIIIVNSTFGNA